MKPDSFTELLRSILRLVGVQYPLRMLAGLAGGFVLAGLLKIAAAGAPANPWLHAAAELSPTYSMALGVVVAVSVILISGRHLDEQTERDLDVIERVIERSGLSPVDRKLAWRNVLAQGGRRVPAERRATSRRAAACRGSGARDASGIGTLDYPTPQPRDPE